MFLIPEKIKKRKCAYEIFQTIFFFKIRAHQHRIIFKLNKKIKKLQNQMTLEFLNCGVSGITAKHLLMPVQCLIM